MSNLIELSKEIVHLDLIVVKEKTLTANTAKLDEYIAELELYVDDAIENDLDVEVIESKIKIIRDTLTDFVDYKKGFTAPLDGIKKELTQREKEIDAQRVRLKEQKEKMLERFYAIAEQAIAAELNKLQDIASLVPDMSIFDSFIIVQRKLKGMLPNEKGILIKSSLEKIYKEFEKVASPIRELIALEEKKATEQKQFEMYLENLNVRSNEIKELDAVIINLEKTKTTIADFYPNIVQQCVRTIDNKIGLAKGNINTLKALEAQKIAENKEKEAVAELNNADDEIIAKINTIQRNLPFILEDNQSLQAGLIQLRELYPQIKYATTKDLAKKIAEEIKEALVKTKEKTAVENKEIVSETFIVHGTIEDMKSLVKFLKEKGIRYE